LGNGGGSLGFGLNSVPIKFSELRGFEWGMHTSKKIWAKHELKVKVMMELKKKYSMSMMAGPIFPIDGTLLR
jgi:hypothetical protein